ncbi:MAG: glycosyl hydrolase 53 family protein, partial [Planctomycetota bacterium]
GRARDRMQFTVCVQLLVMVASASVARATNVSGVDLSTLTRVEANGGTFSDASGTRDLVELVAEAGVDVVRLRIWVAPGTGFNDLPDVLAMARRIDDAGMSLLLDFHYSDSWADPGQQTKPAAWETLTFTELVGAVYAHTHDVVAALAGQGTPPAFVQIGNEITNGMLWEDGRVEGDSNWGNLASLIQAGVLGARDGSPDAHPQIVLHIDRGGDNSASRWFFDHIQAQGVQYDIIGLSYYPWWHGDMAALRDNLADLGPRYGKPILLVETAYPFTLGWNDTTNNIVGEPLFTPTDFPATPEGQAGFLRALRAEVAASPTGVGVCVWEPGWITTPSEGSPWENLAFFDFGGRVLPALESLGSPVNSDVDDSGAVDVDDLYRFEASPVDVDADGDVDADDRTALLDWLRRGEHRVR